jgi:hypothetical protein
MRWWSHEVKKGPPLMSTPRERAESHQLDWYPQRPEGPECQPTRHERYQKPRWIVRLDQHVNVGSHVLEGRHSACTRPAVVDRPYQEDALALRGSTCGWDGVARIGEWRYRDHVSITKIRDQLQTASDLSILLKDVALLCEVLLALVTTVVQHAHERIAQ